MGDLVTTQVLDAAEIRWYMILVFAWMPKVTRLAIWVTGSLNLNNNGLPAVAIRTILLIW
jgi:hypothetical protein